MKRFLLLRSLVAALAAWCASSSLRAQHSTLPLADSAALSRTLQRVTPGSEYQAGGMHKFFAGEHWRDLWATEFEAEVLDLDTFAGGLTPTKKGGSLQTLNLRLMGNDGREYKFRSLNKDGRRTLPPDLQNSFVGDVFQDQVSIGNPMAAVVVPTLLNAVGVLNVAPRIVVMPASERLKRFENEFAGVLGTIEEHPRDDDPAFAAADKIVDGFEIFEKLREDNDEQVDAINYLKARLVDLLIGDRDRHADQYRWAGYKRDGKRVWLPIPRDRDFAFGRYDGVFPWASGLFVHSAVGFGESYPSILELTWIGRHLDRRFLSSLDKPIWDSVTTYIKSTLTDSLMLHALHNMPAEMFRVGGEKMFAMLKARREDLNDAANEFYELLSDVVDVYGSDKPERVEITIPDPTRLEVAMFKKKSSAVLFRRSFSNDKTSEIRIHLLGGDDIVMTEGPATNTIRIRVLGGEGDDHLVNRADKARIEFYDAPGDSTLEENVPEPALEDRYRIVRTLPLFSFNSDDGIILGATTNITQHAFRADPYAHSLAINASYAPQFNRYDAQLLADSYSLLRGAHAELLINAGNLARANFYGIGNETPFSDSLDNADYYETRYHSVRLEPSVTFHLSKPFALRIGAMYAYSSARVTQKNFLDLTKPYGLDVRSMIAFTAGFTFEGRDLPLVPTKGVYVHARASFFPSALTNDFTFAKLSGDIRTYVPARFLGNAFLALHAGGEKTFGTYPFHAASFIGGSTTLRGFARDRFAGDASLFGQAELRAELGRANLFVPGRLGFSLFGDAGRVFVKGERSRQWHSGLGGGLWFNVLNQFVLTSSIAKSSEGIRAYITAGFAF
jgi:hypothetical protein